MPETWTAAVAAYHYPVTRLFSRIRLSAVAFVFMQQWTNWCRHTAQKLVALTLVALTKDEWPIRDVDVAVFQAQGDSLALNALPPL